jgi:hypothetical protein
MDNTSVWIMFGNDHKYLYHIYEFSSASITTWRRLLKKLMIYQLDKNIPTLCGNEDSLPHLQHQSLRFLDQNSVYIYHLISSVKLTIHFYLELKFETLRPFPHTSPFCGSLAQIRLNVFIVQHKILMEKGPLEIQWEMSSEYSSSPTLLSALFLTHPFYLCLI